MWISFNDIAWAPYDDNNRGIIAGALDNGSLKLWDADKLLSGARLVVLINLFVGRLLTA
jgi:protein transport protein SEC31